MNEFSNISEDIEDMIRFKTDPKDRDRHLEMWRKLVLNSQYGHINSPYPPISVGIHRLQLNNQPACEPQTITYKDFDITDLTTKQRTLVRRIFSKLDENEPKHIKVWLNPFKEWEFAKKIVKNFQYMIHGDVEKHLTIISDDEDFVFHEYRRGISYGNYFNELMNNNINYYNIMGNLESDLLSSSQKWTRKHCFVLFVSTTDDRTIRNFMINLAEHTTGLGFSTIHLILRS